MCSIQLLHHQSKERGRLELWTEVGGGKYARKEELTDVLGFDIIMIFISELLRMNQQLYGSLTHSLEWIPAATVSCFSTSHPCWQMIEHLKDEIMTMLWSWVCVPQIIIFWAHKLCLSHRLWVSGSGERIHSKTNPNQEPTQQDTGNEALAWDHIYSTLYIRVCAHILYVLYIESMHV